MRAGNRAMSEKFSELKAAANALWALFHEIETCSDAQLRKIEEQANSTTSTNCWFAVYEVAKIVKPWIKNEWERRARFRQGKRQLTLKEQGNV